MATTKEIADRIRNVGARLEQTYAQYGWDRNVPAVQIFSGHWSGPSCKFMLDLINYAAAKVEAITADQLKNPDLSQFIAALPAICDALQPANIGNDPDAVGGGIISIMNTILSRLPPVMPPQPKPKVDWADISTEPDLLPQDLYKRLRAVEGRLKRLEPRSQTAESKLDEIDSVHNAAVQLPTDMEELTDYKEEMHKVLEESRKTAVEIDIIAESAAQSVRRIGLVTENAENAVKLSEDALRGSTGVGLANSFVKRKNELTITSYWWVGGLLLSLLAAIVIGADRVSTLKDVLISDRSSTVIWVNALLAVLGVGAPVWFAWLSTKQIGSNFKMAEDYAFKASVSQAYEGYRKEAVEINAALQERLFTAALTRLEQEPLRLVNKDDHSSPLQEALNSQALQAFWSRAPGLYDEVVALMRGRTGGTTAVIGSSEAVAETISKKAAD